MQKYMEQVPTGALPDGTFAALIMLAILGWLTARSARPLAKVFWGVVSLPLIAVVFVASQQGPVFAGVIPCLGAYLFALGLSSRRNHPQPTKS